MTKSASASTPAPAPTASKPLKLPDLTIEGFRGFERFHFPKLARVNLLVGPNNSGKTTVLEAVEILADSSLGVLSRGPRRRGETRSSKEVPALSELDYTQQYFGRSLKPGSTFAVSSMSMLFRCALQKGLLSPHEAENPPEISWRFGIEDDRTTLDYAHLLVRDHWVASASGPEDFGEKRGSVQFSDFRATLESLRRLWEAVALEPEGEVALAALRVIDHRAQNVAFEGNRPRVRLTGQQRSIPLASCGEGMTRMLELGIRLANTAHGVLLIDEIDTGLYYRTLPQVWKLVIETARRLDVQVFATTHSRDCVEALAELDLGPDFDDSEVLVHRIDPGATEAVTYDLSRLSRAIEHDIEVR